jgi:peptide/nickel transport system substrate-binding protein
LNFGRLITRALTMYKAKPGKEGLEVVPDLATDVGRASPDKTTWTFTLKDGVKFEDGTPVKAQDVKYGVERGFAPEIAEGPPWARQWLVGGDTYQGPYKDPNGLASIATPDDQTIVFHLNRPVPDFSFTVAMPSFGPVPRAKDTQVNYDNRPVATGPYKIDRYDRGKEMVLARNPHWDPSTDPERTARPDRIVVKEGIDAAVSDQRMLADQGNDQFAVEDNGISQVSVPRIVADPKVRKRLVQASSGCNGYIAINTTHKPLDNVKVRRALNYAVSADAYQAALGGSLMATPSATILPPDMQGYQKYDLYSNDGKGDPARAKRLLAEAGFPHGLSLTLTSRSDPSAALPTAAIQESMAKAGIKLKINAVSSSVYYTVIGDVEKETDLVFGGWCPDWPNGQTFLPPILDGRFIRPKGNNNYSQYNNPDVNRRIDEILAMTDLDAQARAWGDLDRRLMEDAPIIPLIADIRSTLVGSKVTGAYANLAISAQVDYVTVDVIRR